jgi:hypothetical protein
MAIVKTPVGTFGPPEEFGLKDAPAAPPGTWVATCIGVCDQLGVELPKYDNPGVLEKQDRTCFLFGFRDQTGAAYKVASKWMRISGHSKAKLMEFLGQCLGKPFPIGSDYNTPEANGGMKGRKVMLTTQTVQRDGGGSYSTILSVSPVPTGYVQPVAAPAQVAATPAPAPAPAPVAAVVDEIPF